MSIKQTIATPDLNNTLRAKMCLAKIRDIAARGVFAEDSEHVGYALQELSQVLYERTGSEERVFEPIPASMIGDLEKLYEELEFVDGFSQDFAHGQAARNRGQWN